MCHHILPLKRGARIFDRIVGMCTTSMVECLFLSKGRVYFCLCAYFTYRNVFLLSCDVYLNHHFTYTLLLRSHTYMTIVGLDFLSPIRCCREGTTLP